MDVNDLRSAVTLISLLLFGITRSLPPTAIGMIGTPARAAMKAGPSKRASIVSPELRVPSGNMTRGSARSMIA